MQPDSPTGDPSVIVVMGVSGCGKSTIASMLAHRLHWIYEDGDWFHPQSNIEKMLAAGAGGPKCAFAIASILPVESAGPKDSGSRTIAERLSL